MHTKTPMILLLQGASIIGFLLIFISRILYLFSDGFSTFFFIAMTSAQNTFPHVSCVPFSGADRQSDIINRFLC